MAGATPFILLSVRAGEESAVEGLACGAGAGGIHAVEVAIGELPGNAARATRHGTDALGVIDVPVDWSSSAPVLRVLGPGTSWANRTADRFSSADSARTSMLRNGMPAEVMRGPCSRRTGRRAGRKLPSEVGAAGMARAGGARS